MDSHPEFFQQWRKMSLEEKNNNNSSSSKSDKEMSSSKSAKPATSYFQIKKEKQK